jgi:hypothetical protein
VGLILTRRISSKDSNVYKGDIIEKMTTGKYNRVGEVKGPLTIGGSEKKMLEDPTFTYVPTYHVAGPLKDVEAWLKENHPNDVTKVLQNSYNVKNLKKAGVKKAYTKEMEEWKVQKEERSKTRQDEKSINLLILVELLKRYQTQRKTDSVTDKVAVKTLRDKLSEVVSSGKVMDVTSSREGGRGILRVVLKSNSIKKRLSESKTDPLYNVVYNPRTENFQQGVRNFMVEYGGFSDEQIETVVSALSQGSEVTVKTSTTPVSTSRTTSPLTKRFTSPLRRNTETTVDDLLDGLTV